MTNAFPIGVFDSGYGGLTVLRAIQKLLPQYDYIYLGDNARTPYGTRSYDTVYEYTLQSVQWLLKQHCALVILACNTASAKALRTLQQTYLPSYAPDKRVLGVIRPTAEVIGNFSRTGQIGILATKGTVQSGSYVLEIQKFFPGMQVFQHACPMWVPLIENNEHHTQGAAWFIKKDVDALLHMGKEIDTVLLGCTHYPLIEEEISSFLPPHIRVVSQGMIVAEALKDYLHRHPEIEKRCSKSGKLAFYTTDAVADFDNHSQTFFGRKAGAVHIDL